MNLFGIAKKIIYGTATAAIVLISVNRELNFIGDQAAIFLKLAACLFLALSAWMFFSDQPRQSASPTPAIDREVQPGVNFRALGFGVFLTLVALMSTFLLTDILGTRIDGKRDTILFLLAFLFSTGVGLITLSVNRSKYVKDLFRGR